MRTSRIVLLSSALLFGVGAAGLARFVEAEDTHAMPTPQKVVSQPFLDSLIGSYTTQSTMTHDGKASKGTGRSTFSRSLGGTAVLQDYEMTGPGPDGQSMRFFGHGVVKVSDDGKTAVIWWFDNMSPDVMKLTGPVTDTSLELSGPSLQGGQVTVSWQKTPAGFDFKMKEAGGEMTDVYTRTR